MVEFIQSILSITMSTTQYSSSMPKYLESILLTLVINISCILLLFSIDLYRTFVSYCVEIIVANEPQDSIPFVVLL